MTTTPIMTGTEWVLGGWVRNTAISSGPRQRHGDGRRLRIGVRLPGRSHLRTALSKAQPKAGGQIGRTNYYVRVDGWRNPALTTMVTAATEWQARAFRSLPRQAFLPNWRSATNISKMPRQLSLMCYAGSLPEQIYTVWVDEDDLLDAMDSEMDRDDRMRLLANMMSRGILEHGSGKWRAVP